MTGHDLSDKPLVSVAMITFNQADLVQDALRSVISQTYRNIEIIIGDDASADDTLEVAKGILATCELPQIILSKSRNVGISKNLNDVLKHCRGKYIALLGGDDIWFPEKIEKSVSYLEKYPDASFLCHGAIVIDEQGADLNEALIPSKIPLLFDAISAFSGKYKFYGSTQVLRNYTDLPLLDEGIRFASDLIHTVELIEKKGNGLAIPDILAKYRKSSRGVTIGNSRQIQEDGLIGAVMLAIRHPHLGHIAVTRMAKIFYRNAIIRQKEGDLHQAIYMFYTSLLLRFKCKTIIRLVYVFVKHHYQLIK